MTYIKENGFVKFYFNDYILLITVKNSQPNDLEWEDTIKLTKKFYDAAEIDKFKFSIIFDLKLMGILSYNKIKQWGDLFIEYKELLISAKKIFFFVIFKFDLKGIL